jgi:anti-sigma B factor antagonist
LSFSITVREIEGVTVLDLSGELFFGEARTCLEDNLKRLLGHHKPKILVNMKEISRFDDSLTSLISALFSARKQGGDLKLINPTRAIQEVLEATRLTSFFEIYSTEAEGLASFK